jgi:RNA polymerase sigma-70 factor (ECF subfamily)
VLGQQSRTAFLSCLGAEERSKLATDPGLDAWLERTLETARAAWPNVLLADEVFLAFLGARVSGGSLESLIIADAWLACACERGDPIALSAFEVTHLKRLGIALARSGSRPETVAEVQQRLRVQLLVRSDTRPPGISTYQARSDLNAWLRVVAMREAARVDKERQRDGEVPDQLMLVELAASDPELAYLKDLYRREVVMALGAALAELPARERQLLRHHVVEGMSIDEIGVLFEVHRATAARWLERARELLCEIFRTQLRHQLNIPPSELDDILALVRSRLGVSVRHLLQVTPK